MDLPYTPNGDSIFIHIPKTAGISIYTSVLKLQRKFGWYSGLSDIQFNQLPNKERSRNNKEHYISKFPTSGATHLGHCSFRSLINDNLLDKDYFDNSFKFAFVRNPYDRLVSLYKYHLILERLKLDFDSFVSVLFQEFQKNTIPPIGSYNIKTFNADSPLYHISIYGNQYNPMIHWIPEQPILICFLETFEQDIDKLLSFIGFQGKRKVIPKSNTSKHDNFITFYKNRDTIDMVNTIYKDDFNAFGYDML
jgi:hypothetical protein